ncbi:EcsC family protein [Tumebacillus sp. ITR2]|uniref:EcsC family protein n=1 Tax=Tumebacillus amylolyticus TaxID=2801339 RepID=A0ABS1J636_9BACL|nr:EcsC family protein [Tumebacillus amylolyticus]MBL0385665.1 EcsC family protein [Tumebacillus amylolyticus]
METREELLLALQVVEKWEKDQKDLWFWEKLGRLPFALLDKVTPKFVQEKVGQVLDEMISYVETGGRYLTSSQGIVEKFEKKTGTAPLTLEQVGQVPLAIQNEVAREYAKARSTFATIQGATTGIGGLFTLAIDIPMLLGLSLKVLQEVCMCYGFDPQDKSERVFMIKVLQFSSSDYVGKQAILSEERSQLFSQLQGWREVVLIHAENFGWKKLFQLIPVAGIVFGAYLNRKTIEDLAETASMMYRKRRILERLQVEMV